MTDSRVAVVTEYNQPLEIQKIPLRDLEQDAMMARVEAATLCGTDVHRWHGAQNLIPYVPGHETAMSIVEMNAPRWDNLGEPLKVGDRILSAYPSCGHCYYCSVARTTNLCKEGLIYGAHKPGVFLGGLSEYHYVPPKGEIIRIPEEVSSPLAASAACALRTVMHGFERLGPILSHETVVVQGAGPLGLYSLAVARDRGAAKVLVIGAPEERLQVAREFGADATCNLEEITDAAARKEWVLSHTSGRGPDVVVQVAVSAAIPEGLEFIRPGGRYVSIGGGGGPEVSIPTRLLSNYITYFHIRTTMARHFYQALQFLATKKKLFPFEKMLSGTYTLEEASEAIKAMASLSIVKPVILPNGE